MSEQPEVKHTKYDNIKCEATTRSSKKLFLPKSSKLFNLRKKNRNHNKRPLLAKEEDYEEENIIDRAINFVADKLTELDEACFIPNTKRKYLTKEQKEEEELQELMEDMQKNQLNQEIEEEDYDEYESFKDEEDIKRSTPLQKLYRFTCLRQSINPQKKQLTSSNNSNKKIRL